MNRQGAKTAKQARKPSAELDGLFITSSWPPARCRGFRLDFWSPRMRRFSAEIAGGLGGLAVHKTKTTAARLADANGSERHLDAG